MFVVCKMYVTDKGIDGMSHFISTTVCSNHEMEAPF